MLRLFKHSNSIKEEITSHNNIYTVYELGVYSFEYYSGEIDNKPVYIEDLPLSFKKLKYEKSSIKSSEDRFFQDFFGLTALTINSEQYHLNIKIEKLKLSEIEDIFYFLWSKEEKLFDVFFSKSTQKLGSSKDGLGLGKTSKLISYIEYYIQSFSSMLNSFRASPHTVLRPKKEIIDYSHSRSTAHSIDWILGNLDNIFFDLSYQNHPDAIRFNNSYGIIDKVESEVNINSFSTYENEIILGSFNILLDKLSDLKSEISSNINISRIQDSKYADFRDLKRIPFIKLFEDSMALEEKVKQLKIKYNNIFIDVLPRTELPRITPVFAKKLHYSKAYKLVKDLRTFKFDLSGEFKLLNIRKLSQLYEVYNLYQIIESFKEKLKLIHFEIVKSTNRADEIIDKISFTSKDIVISILYETKYYDNPKNIDLVRIDVSKANYYNPDYVIEFKTKKHSKYYILDSKYSKLSNVRNHYLNDCIFKYILNTGFVDYPYKKIENLSLIFPSEIGENHLMSKYNKPTIDLIPSKPKFEGELKHFIHNIIESNVSSALLVSK